ncbi:uncharacterized protein N7458_011402 [Penicillium daleae]|uniref:Uncharacterized protein n=1 Tax=Penicillium daleae TaxID=63821 RepID=A0AAD6BRF5_9EURO|nr:uncharacterized protein N7458_011402 [Penicillium daleae]KAJ5432246.1 hypothetical protein N7458_011402 [Penicillium daleae]
MLRQSVLADAITDRYNGTQAMKQKIYNAAPLSRASFLVRVHFRLRSARSCSDARRDNEGITTAAPWLRR